MEMEYNEDDHCQQLKEAVKRLSNPPDSIDELLHILDQLEILLAKVDQTPNSIMQETLSQPMKALVNGRLLEHSSMDVKVYVASCLCEITRITAPDAPYSDEEMKGVFQCIVSSLENLSDKSSRSYDKRVSILDIVSRVRACVIMLDLECEDLIVKLFEHFLNSVRDHHLGNAFSFMVNIMTCVFEESEDISLNMLKPLLASVRNNGKGVLPVARKLGEEVIKKSAENLRPYLNKSVAVLGDSLGDYSQVLTSICEGTTNSVEHNDKSASVQPKVVDATSIIVSLDDTAPVTSNGETVTKNTGDVGGDQLKKLEGGVDHPKSDFTNKLDTNDSVAENTENVKLKPDSTTKSTKPLVSETVHDENVAEKTPEIVVCLEKPIETKVANAPSQSGSQQEVSQSKIQIKKGGRPKKKGPSQTDPPSAITVLTKVIEQTSDPELSSPKRARKKTPKAQDNKPSVTAGSDVEPSKNPGKKVETSDSGKKPVKRSRKKVDVGGSVAKKPKLSGKKVPESKKRKQDDNKEVEARDLEVKQPSKRSLKKDIETDSAAKPLKPSGKKGKKSKVVSKPSEDIANKDEEETDSDDQPLKLSEKKKEEADSVAKPLKSSGKKGRKSKVISKPSEDIANKDDEETDSDNQLLKPSENKEEETDSAAKPLKSSGRKGKKSKVISKPSEDIANKDDEETDSDNQPLKPSENKKEETDSNHKPLNLSEEKDDEETDSDNIPLKLSANRGNKTISSVVKSKNKDGKKQGHSKSVVEKDQTKSLSEDDDGMDVSLNSVLKKVTKTTKGKSNYKGALSTGSKRKRSVTKKKVTETIKYDDSLVGQKVKVWWPEDKMYYEGVVDSFDSAEKKHKVLYLDGEEEILNLKTEKWEIIKEYSTPIKEVDAEVQNTDTLPEIAGSSAGESKVNKKEVDSKEDKETKKDDKKATPQKIVYARGKKGTKSKTKSPDDVKESEGGNAAEEPEGEKEKSTETPKVGSKTGKKKRKMN